MKYFITLLLGISTLTAFSQSSDVFQIARTGTVEQMKAFFIQDKKSIDAIDSNGFTPLILATYRSNNDVALFLIENTANLNYSSKMGSTLMAAIYKNNTLIFDALIKKGIDLNLKDENKTTALMLAVTLQNLEFTKKIIESGADKTLKNHINKTAFQLALDTNNQQLIQLFN
jgi:ankyrin repeat protein